MEKRFGFTACFVTKGLPFAWTGGNRAITQMQEACKVKGAAVCGAAIMTWGGGSADLLPAVLVPVLYYLSPVHNLFVRIGGVLMR